MATSKHINIIEASKKQEDLIGQTDKELSFPNDFWRYYDIYRRKIITLAEFSTLSDIRIPVLKKLLNKLKSENP